MSGSASIVVVEQDSDARTLLELALRAAGPTVLAFGNPAEAAAYLSEHGDVALVVAGVASIARDAGSLLYEIRVRSAGAPLPLIAIGEPQARGPSFQLPPLIGDLEERIDALDLRVLRERVAARLAQSDRRLGGVQRDALTGAYTAAVLPELLRTAAALSKGQAVSMVVARIEIDETASADSRDDLLFRAAGRLASALREGDDLVRTGSCEFASLHAVCDGSGAAAIAERMRMELAQDASSAEIRPIFGTTSVNDPADARADRMLERARAAASSGARNR